VLALTTLTASFLPLFAVGAPGATKAILACMHLAVAAVLIPCSAAVHHDSHNHDWTTETGVRPASGQYPLTCTSACPDRGGRSGDAHAV
jgi:hypothetical protein